MILDQDIAKSVVDATPLSAARLDGRAVLRIRGADRVSFLQGLVSNDVAQAAPGRAVYACFLTPQGKFLHEMLIFADDAALYLDTEGGDRAADLKRRLSMYRLRSDVSIDAPEPELAVIAVFGKAAGQASLPGDMIATPDPRTDLLGMRMLCPVDRVDAVMADLAGQGARTAPAADYDIYRLRLGVPDGSRDMLVERATLMESGIDKLNGISWDKGCYMGQELTARMKYRNLGKRRLVLFRIDGPDDAVTPGATIELNGRDVGEVRSVAGGHAFALVRVADILDARQLPEKCHIGSVQLLPVSLDPPDNPTE